MKSWIKNIIASCAFRINNSKYYKRLSDQYLNELERNFEKTFNFFGSNSKLPLQRRIINPQYISIGNDFSSLYNLRLEAWDSYAGQNFKPELIIGNNVKVNSDCHIGCIDRVEIGDNVLMASRIYISDHSHGEISFSALHLNPMQRSLFSKGPVIIEDNVWIGEGVCIMPGVTVGRNCIIGANAVVTKSFDANSVIAGIPAVVIKKLVEIHD